MATGLRTVRHDETFTADENDVLRDTDLRQAPGFGAVSIWAASTVSDSVISVRIAGQALATRIIISNRGANAPINENQEAPVVLVPTRPGDPFNVDLDIVTAATVRLVVIWAGR